MASSFNCAFCGSSDENLILFSDDTLKKCRNILLARKKHNLKHKDVVLPVDSLESGYHRQCYKSFTALMKKYMSQTSQTQVESTEPQPSSIQSPHPVSILLPAHATIDHPTAIPELSEPAPSTSQENIMVLEDLNVTFGSDVSTEREIDNEPKNSICIFCDQKTKKHRTKRQPLHCTEKEKFISTLIEGSDSYPDFFKKVQNASQPNIYYHHICHVDFTNKIKSLHKNTTKGIWHENRQNHQAAFDEISVFLEENVIGKGRCFFLTYLHRYYIQLLEKDEDTTKVTGNFTPQHLEDKIVKSFKKEINCFFIHNKKLIAPKHLTTIDDESFEILKNQDILQKAALLLRQSVKEVQVNKLPTNVTVQNLKEGEVSVPQTLSDFYFTLISGNNNKRKKSKKCIRQVQSFCEDVMYSVHNGKIKTSKHIVLGMTLKSLTSSRKIIDIIHRYGHCISYPGIEELETEATYASIKKSSLCPETIDKNPNLCTGVAYDNFDRFVETGSGKDTLHDTVGIIYQNIDFDNTHSSQLSNVLSPNDEEVSSTKKRRRRTFEVIVTDEVSYPKKPKMTENLQIAVHEVQNLQPVNLKLYNTIDAIFMISHALQIPKVPMWVGFNSVICDDTYPKQKISYLTPINSSPTNKSVVLETMKQSQQICQDLQQASIQVTYDLAIAKVALQIQATEKPTFDNLFIHLGPFHIMMAYFKVLGKVIIDCGLPNVMVESNLIAMGSLHGFLEGKHFNRCKKLHPLMAMGLETLHFKSFLDMKNIDRKSVV